MADASVCAGIREDGEPLPLIVKPKDGNDSLAFLKSWVAENGEWIDQKLLEHGRYYFEWAGLVEIENRSRSCFLLLGSSSSYPGSFPLDEKDPGHQAAN